MPVASRSKKRHISAEAPVGRPNAATVAVIVAEANRHVEVAALIRAVGQQVLAMFHANGDVQPRFLLRRRGSGARAALIESVVDAEGALERLARDYDKRARELLELPVNASDRERLADVDATFTDEAVPREAAND